MSYEQLENWLKTKLEGDFGTVWDNSKLNDFLQRNLPDKNKGSKKSGIERSHTFLEDKERWRDFLRESVAPIDFDVLKDKFKSKIKNASFEELIELKKALDLDLRTQILEPEIGVTAKDIAKTGLISRELELNDIMGEIDDAFQNQLNSSKDSLEDVIDKVKENVGMNTDDNYFDNWVADASDRNIRKEVITKAFPDKTIRREVLQQPEIRKSIKTAVSRIQTIKKHRLDLEEKDAEFIKENIKQKRDAMKKAKKLKTLENLTTPEEFKVKKEWSLSKIGKSIGGKKSAATKRARKGFAEMFK